MKSDFGLIDSSDGTMVLLSYMKKEIVVGIIIALLVVAGFAFRGKIFNSALEVSQETKEGESTTTPLSDQSATTTDQTDTSGNAPVAGGTPKTQPAVIYRGRPLDEVKFSQTVLQSMSVERRNQFSADIRKYAKMAKETPEYIAAWLQTAILKKAIEDYEGARDIWIYVTIARPHEATAFLNLGDLYTNYLKDYVSAEKNYQNAIKAEPKNAMGYLGLSDLYIFFYKERVAQAEQILKQGIAANPDDVNLQKALARLHDREAK